MFTASTLFLCAFSYVQKIMWDRRALKKKYSLYSIFIASEFLKDRLFYYLIRFLDALFKGLYHSKTPGLPCNFRDVEGIIQRTLHALQWHVSYFHTELNFKCLLFFLFTNFSKGVNEHTFNVWGIRRYIIEVAAYRSQNMNGASSRHYRVMWNDIVREFYSHTSHKDNPRTGVVYVYLLAALYCVIE